MIRKDLQLFFSDPRAVILTFAVPIAIASFFGSIFSGPRNSGEQAKIPIAIVDQDDSVISAAIVAGARADKAFTVSTPPLEEARQQVRRGRLTVGVVIPKGFGDAAGQAFFTSGAKPEIDLLYDPSHGMELAMVRGILAEHVMQAVSREMFGGPGGRKVVDDTFANLEQTGMPPEQQKALRDMLTSVQGFYNQPGAAGQSGAPAFSMPYQVREEAVTARANVAYNGYAHSFAGMAIQFLLFAAANFGVEMLLERQRGLWKRFRSAPVSRWSLLVGKAATATLVGLMTLWVSFGFAMIVFGVRIQGSLAGFVGVSIACSLMAATFGLLIAALGKTPAATRGVTTFAILMMVMLGGAWVPTFVFPAWLQRVTVVVPARWAVDGFDAMTWRGIGFSGAIAPIAVMFGFSLAFWIVTVTRFRWEEA